MVQVFIKAEKDTLEEVHRAQLVCLEDTGVQVQGSAVQLLLPQLALLQTVIHTMSMCYVSNSV